MTVFVDLAAALGTGPAAPQHFSGRGWFADRWQMCSATRAIGASKGADSPSALRPGLSPDDRGNRAENDNEKNNYSHGSIIADNEA